MITAEEIRQKSFEKSMRGYRPEEVEAFLAQISATVEQLITDKAETEKKLFVMAEKVEEYAQDFDVDEHVERWIDARKRGVSGVPSTIRELLEDAEAIQKMLNDLAEALNKDE